MHDGCLRVGRSVSHLHDGHLFGGPFRSHVASVSDLGRKDVKTQRLKIKTQDDKDPLSLVVYPSLSPWPTPRFTGSIELSSFGYGANVSGFSVSIIESFHDPVEGF
jgi:hypothetical protein